MIDPSTIVFSLHNLPFSCSLAFFWSLFFLCPLKRLHLQAAKSSSTNWTLTRIDFLFPSQLTLISSWLNHFFCSTKQNRLSRAQLLNLTLGFYMVYRGGSQQKDSNQCNQVTLLVLGLKDCQIGSFQYTEGVKKCLQLQFYQYIE